MERRRAADRRAMESRIVERRWRERLAAWKRSGQDERVFCEREKVGLCALRWWAKRLAGESVGDGRQADARPPVTRAKPRSGLANPDAATDEGASKWMELSDEWERSGLMQTEFCRQRGLAVHTFRWWRWRLGRSRKAGHSLVSKATVTALAAPTATPAFLPVQVIAEPRRTRRQRLSTMDIVLRRRRRVRVTAEFDARLLARVVSVLEAIP